MARKQKRFIRKNVPYDERLKSRYGSTWSSQELGLARDNNQELYNFVNRNKKALRSMSKNDAIRVMKSHCSYDLSRVNPNYISKTSLNYIIGNHK
ncbi:MAG: hypothetical protein J1F32_01845 [Erysipelotrichales bacterium]|nr:hypothetical protein [Erysipelotrichales bacterium]